jgi:hypothetical protein
MRPLPQVTDCGAGYRGYGQAEGPVSSDEVEENGEKEESK